MSDLKAVVGILFMAIAFLLIVNGSLSVDSEEVFKNCMNIAR